MLSKNYNGFIEEVACKNSLPLFGTIELTYTCDYKCVHCYCRDQSKKDLSFLFWKNIFDQIYNLGGINITLTGGDPLKHSQFLEIYHYLKIKGFLVTIFSNGYPFNKKILDFFEKNPPVNIEITLNSLNKETYENITGTKNTLRRVLSNIYEIKKRNIPLILKCNGLKQNRQEILKIKNFTQDLLGKGNFKFESFIFPGLAGEKEPLKYRLNPEDIINIERNDPDMFNQRKRESHIYQNLFFNPGGLYHCNSWLKSYYINPLGLLQFCHLSKKYSTDLKKEKFKYGFAKFLNILKEKPKQYLKCNECEYLQWCSYCPTRNYLETKNETIQSEYFCKLAKARAHFIKNKK